MDFVQTNNNPIAEWADRTQPTDATQTKVAVPGDLQASKGIAWEYAIDLANAVHKNVWVNIPARASDDYVRNLAALLRDRLAPDLAHATPGTAALPRGLRPIWPWVVV